MAEDELARAHARGVCYVYVIHNLEGVPVYVGKGGGDSDKSHSSCPVGVSDWSGSPPIGARPLARVPPSAAVTPRCGATNAATPASQAGTTTSTPSAPGGLIAGFVSKKEV